MSLDETLAAWAATVRLSDADAADIYERIVMTPTPAHKIASGLDPTWWRQFTADFTARIITSTRPATWVP
jgi:hypothetical protein